MDRVLGQREFTPHLLFGQAADCLRLSASSSRRLIMAHQGFFKHFEGRRSRRAPPERTTVPVGHGWSARHHRAPSTSTASDAQAAVGSWTIVQVERALGEMRTVMRSLRTQDVVEAVLLRLRVATGRRTDI